MSSSTVLRLFSALTLLASVVANTGSRFRGGDATRTVATSEVESSLRQSMEALLTGQGATSQRLAAIEGSLWQTFEALPKNNLGRLAPRAVRYIVHNYFAKEHGWLITGLEPHGMQANISEVHEVSILQDKAPALVEALLEARHADRGLSLSDVVVMVAALERLIFDESLELLEASYTLNGLAPEQRLDERSMHEVLTSYLLVFEMGARGNLSDTRAHQAMKANAARSGGSWPTIVEYGEDTMRNFGFARQHAGNPFVGSRYSFQDASRIVENLAQGYGKWQNTECRRMKEDLMELSPDGSGRVPLSAFYSQPENADYQFTESLEYLREIGALEELPGAGPTVRIANYLAGPSNCIASSSYYSVCCLSDCEGLMNDLEHAVRAPTAPAARLLALVSNLSSSTVDAPRQLPRELEDRLHAVAERHGGEVPLHGRLFAQWLHYAFPNECAYPHVADNAAALTPGHWVDRKATALPDERQLQSEKTPAPVVQPVEHVAATWSDVEVLPALEVPQQRSSLRSCIRVAMQLSVLLVVARFAASHWRVAVGSASDKKDKKAADWVLPL